MLAVGALGVAFPGAGRVVDRRGAIDPTLAVLVLTAGLAVDLGHLSRIGARLARLIAALVAGSIWLPLLAWLLAGAASGGTRDALLSVGVAPPEVASVALTALASGEVPVAATLLVASTLITVVAAGPVLSLLAGASVPAPEGLTVVLAAVVAGPLALGVVARRVVPAPVVLDAGRVVGNLSLLVLLWEVASQVRIGPAYLLAAGLLAAFLAGSGLLAVAVTAGVERSGRPGLLLPLAMRDFAVAAGIAASAFGPRATGALGLYGLLVLLTGTLAARRGSKPDGSGDGSPQEG
ncbi:MAG: hypothetical protein M0T80_00070 [Actinomycetota bacterium]|nr:hypothetical protein [Actinomycetota bacterium]